MMRKKIVSLCMALVLCLSLLPVTALAAGEDAPNTLYVGNEQVISGSSTTYWTTDNSGGLTRVENATDNSANWSVRYNPTNATLTLKGANITGNYHQYYNPHTAGIYALCSQDQPVALTIELIGTNTITGYYGIYVNAEISADSYGTDASLTITGESNGSLKVSGSYHGIYVKSGTGGASLNINDASVVASSSSSNFGYAGVYVQSSAHATSSPQLSLAVNGGSLTANGGTSSDGILFNVVSSQATGATTSLTVSENAIVDARNGGISAKQISNPINTDISATSSNGGIVFDGTEGTVYGNVTLDKNLTINQGETLTIPEGSSLNTNGNLTNNGTIVNKGDMTGEPTGGTVVTAPAITTESLPDGMAGQTYTEKLEATGNNITWSLDSGTLPAGLTLNSDGTITGTPSVEDSSTFTVKAENSAGGATKEYTLNIKPATVSVTSVTLDQTELPLVVGGTAKLTAKVEPDTATDKSVNWESSNPDVATVDNGVVTAKAPGTATITVTTKDGSHTAACTVTVTRPYIPPANPNYRITVEATQGGTVTADPTAAKAGTTVTLTPSPNAGYEVGDVTVTDRFGEAVEVTANPDGTYTFTMPSGQVSVNVTFVEMEAEPLPFTDVNKGDWFHDAVRYVYDNGLMDGVGDGQFAPNATTNRAMVVTILYRLAGEPAVAGDVGFTDVEPGLWYTDAVLWAAEKGIVNGISETEFSPSGDLTREQLATILYRYAESMGYDVSAQADLSGFPDAGDIQSYATQALSWAVAEGLLQGFEDDSLQPQSTATRAQIATILMRFLSAAPTA